MIKLKIVGKVIKLDIPEKFIWQYMPVFACDDSLEEDIVIDITRGEIPEMPAEAVKNFDFITPAGDSVHNVYTIGGDVYYSRFTNHYIAYLKYKRDYKRFTVCMNENIPGEGLDGDAEYVRKRAVFFAVRRAFLMIMAANGGFEIHSSALLYKGEAVVFSAMAGTGKTTHTNLWKEVFPDEVEIINGDKGLCVPEQSGSYIHGWPWCGSSGRFMNIKAPIKAIVFLERAEENGITRISSVPECFMRLTSRCFMPVWENDLFMKTLDMVENVARSVDCYLLRCLPDHDAARVAEREIFKR